MPKKAVVENLLGPRGLQKPRFCKPLFRGSLYSGPGLFLHARLQGTEGPSPMCIAGMPNAKRIRWGRDVILPPPTWAGT
eukprot:11156543-Lingulodinium_polyedra.AAC.1